MTPQQIIDHLTYTNYAYNRRRSPDILPEQWEKILGPSVWEMEEEFQREEQRA